MNQDFQIRHGSKHYRPCNQYKHHFHRSHHRSLLDGRSVKKDFSANLPAATISASSNESLMFGSEKRGIFFLLTGIIIYN